MRVSLFCQTCLYVFRIKSEEQPAALRTQPISRKKLLFRATRGDPTRHDQGSGGDAQHGRSWIHTRPQRIHKSREELTQGRPMAPYGMTGRHHFIPFSETGNARPVLHKRQSALLYHLSSRDIVSNCSQIERIKTPRICE